MHESGIGTSQRFAGATESQVSAVNRKSLAKAQAGAFDPSEALLVDH